MLISGLIADYLKRMIGNGFVLKEVPGPDVCPCFQLSPTDKEMYFVLFGNVRMQENGSVLHFVRRGGRLQIACTGII